MEMLEGVFGGDSAGVPPRTRMTFGWRASKSSSGRVSGSRNHGSCCSMKGSRGNWRGVKTPWSMGREGVSTMGDGEEEEEEREQGEIAKWINDTMRNTF